ncbi:MAG: hypothetical protein WA771_12545, partial [Chthoniobacterales bacterium]
QNSGQVASATYYRMDGDWYRNDGLGASNPIAGTDLVFKAGQGVIIRKFPSSGNSVVWSNQPTY